MKRRGISLIVLIIMIIVIIILAAAVILTMAKNNPLSAAKEAAFKSDVRNFQDDLALYIGNKFMMNYSGNRNKIETEDMPSTDVMKTYIKSFTNKYEHKLGIYKDELVYYKPDEEVVNKVTDVEEKWLKDLGIKKKTVETSQESFLWGSDDPNNKAYYTLTKYIGTQTDVIVPDRCHVVGQDAFKNSSITSVKLQEGVVDLEDNAFSNCNSLERVDLPDSLEYLSNFCFSSCKNLKSITIPEKVGYIPQNAFASCYSLEEVILPSKLTAIHSGAFKSCGKLKNIVLPDSINYLAEKAFSESGLEVVNLSANVNNIDGGVFSNCKNLTSINVNTNNQSYISVDGVLYNKDKSVIVQFPAGKELESYTIASEVETIYNDAFYGCDKLKSIILGNKVKSIGAYSFMYCSNLTNVNFPTSLEEIKYNIIYGCDNLSNIYIPANVQKISSSAFYIANTSKLTIDCEIEEENIPTGWQSGWYVGNGIVVNYGVKK